MYNDEIFPLESTYQQMAKEYAEMLKLHEKQNRYDESVRNLLNEIYNMENCSKEKILFQIRSGRLKKTRRLSQIVSLKTQVTEMIKEVLGNEMHPIKCDKCELSFSPPNAGGVRRDLMDCQLFILEKCDELVLYKQEPLFLKIAYVAMRCLNLY